MELEKVKAAVLDEARREAGRITAEAKEKADARLARAQEALEHEHEMLLAHAENALNEASAMALQRARTEKAKELLAEKNAVIERVFASALKKLAAMPEDAYKALLVDWLAEIGPDAAGEVRFNRKDREAIGEEVVRRANEKLGGETLSLSGDTVGAAGGFLFQAPSYELDRTFEARIRAMRREMVPEIAAQLFAGEK